MDALSIDHQVAQALAQGDVRRAAQLLVLHHADAVYATCRALLRDATLAEDLSQEAFVRAIAALPTFRGDAQSRTWLLSIARNLCLDHLRRQKGPIDERVELDVEGHESETPPPFDLLVRRGDVERGLSVLSETERAIVVLHHAHGVSYAELAGSFNLAEGTVRMRMSRALTKMRDAVEPPITAALGAPLAPRELELDEAATTPRKSEGIFERLRRAAVGPPKQPAPAAPPPAAPVPRAPGAAAPRPMAPPMPSAPRAMPRSEAAASIQAVVWAAPAGLRARLAALLPA